tara:strand:- start:1357 stop:1788 length:432 start_codon:yes stop_codon:yes gene_type:complete
MRYYIDDLLNININELIEYLKHQYHEKIILANDGYYKYINNELYKYKISNFDDNIIIQLNKNIKIIGTNIHWKKYDKVYKIPFLHNCINKQIYKFKITENITLFVEKIENKIKDLYFTSAISHDNFFFKEEVISFLSSVNKYL